nr:hypothetical protein CTI12_AA105810 [Tanacetum cinerariifolium]
MRVPSGGGLILYQAYGRKAHLLEDKRNGRDYGLAPRFTKKYCSQSVKTARRRRDLSGDGVWILATVSQSSRLKVDLEPSTRRRRQKHQATPETNLNPCSSFIEYLELGYGGGLIVISDGTRQCARHIYANFKRKWIEIQYKILFWGASSCTVEQRFLQKMEQIKELDPAAHKRQRDRYGDKKRGNNNVLAGSSKKRGSIRIGSPIKRGEDNQVTEGGSMGNLTTKEYQHKMDMEALDEVQREITAEEAEQERIRQIWDENEANDLYWGNMAKEFGNDELNKLEDSLKAVYSFDTILEFQDNKLNVHQVSMDLPVNEAPKNYTIEESWVQDPDPKPTIPTQESQIQTRSKIRKRVAKTTSLRIHVKNRGISERIAKM